MASGGRPARKVEIDHRSTARWKQLPRIRSPPACIHVSARVTRLAHSLATPLSLPRRRSSSPSRRACAPRLPRVAPPLLLVSPSHRAAAPRRLSSHRAAAPRRLSSYGATTPRRLSLAPRHRSSSSFTRVAQLEEQAEVGERLLRTFHKELEYLRRPPIPSNSDVMNEILKSNCTGRMKSYMEAGCSLQCRNISNINQLRVCENGLQDHINKVKKLLQELECLVKDGHGITLTASLSALEVSEDSLTDNEPNNESCFVEEERRGDQLDNDVSFVTLMIIVHNMLKLDYTMQEKIINALSLKTSSSELDGYCRMWDLRPYINDNVMQLAWKMCP